MSAEPAASDVLLTDDMSPRPDRAAGVDAAAGQAVARQLTGQPVGFALVDDSGRVLGSVSPNAFDQVRRRRRLIVGARPSPRAFSASEDERLRACWDGAGDIEAVASELGRSAGSLGIATYARVWSQLDDQRLRVLSAEGLAIESIAQALGRTPEALCVRARRLGFPLPSASQALRSGRRWTVTEDEVLRVNGALNPAVLASTLGRSSSAVVQRMRRLGIGAGRSPHHPVVRRGALTPGERVTAARELRAGGPRRVLAVARRLDASPHLVRAAAAQSTRPVGEVVASSGRDH